MKIGSFFKHLVQDVEHAFQPAAKSPPASAPAPDTFAATNPPPMVLDPSQAASGPAKSPYYLGRVKTDGRAFVGANGQPFTYRSVSEFLLPSYINSGNEQAVAARMDERVQQGYSVLRTFTMLDWAQPPLHPFDDFEAYKANLEKMLDMAEQRGLNVELTLFTDVDKNIPRSRINEYADAMADIAQRHPNTFIEVCNESFKNGLSETEIYDLAKRIKARAPDVMIAGSSPDNVDGIDPNASRDAAGHYADGREFADGPFDYLTIHSERADGDNGWRWVRHLKEGGDIGATVNKPVVQDEPMGSNGSFIPGRRDNDPQRFRDAALVAHVTNQYFTFHNEGAVTPDPNAAIAEPGQDQIHLSDLIPSDPRGTRFINGQWPDCPFDPNAYFNGNGLLRFFTKMKTDGSGFYSYPVDVTKDMDLPLRQATHLKVVDASNGQLLVDRDFAAGERLHIAAGSDVVIYGGNVEVPQLAKAGAAVPAVSGSDEPVPSQHAAAGTSPGLDAATAQDVAQRLYEGILGRAADPGGLRAYADTLQRGQLGQAVSSMFASDEFKQRQVTKGALATSMYGALLGQAPGAELADAVSRLGSGDGASLAMDLVRRELAGSVKGNAIPPQRPAPLTRDAALTPDVANALVNRLYRALLGRDADLGGLTGYARLAQQGQLAQVVDALVASDEFKQRSQAVTAGELSGALYRELLDRDPDPVGALDTEQQVLAGQLAARTLAMVRSDEYRQHA